MWSFSGTTLMGLRKILELYEINLCFKFLHIKKENFIEHLMHRDKDHTHLFKIILMCVYITSTNKLQSFLVLVVLLPH